MSQKKVDAYKAEKANREKIMKKEKLILTIEKLAALVLCIVAVCWIGYSVYGKVTEGQEDVKTETVMDTSALDSYLNGLIRRMPFRDSLFPNWRQAVFLQ